MLTLRETVGLLLSNFLTHQPFLVLIQRLRRLGLDYIVRIIDAVYVLQAVVILRVVIVILGVVIVEQQVLQNLGTL